MRDSEKLDLLLAGVGEINTRLTAVENDMAEVKERLTVVETGMEKMEVRLTAVETGMEKMEARLTAVETGMEKMEARLTAVETGMEKMEARLTAVETGMEKMEVRLTTVESNTRITKLTIENELRTNIQRIAEGHLDLSRNLKEAMKPNNELEMLTVRVNLLETDVQELKQKRA